MKQSIQFIALALATLIFGCKSEKSHRTFENVIIAGKILNQQKYPDKYTIKLFENDLVNFEGNTHTEFINEDGTFRFVFEKSFSSDVYLIYNDLFSLFVNPGDSIYLELDADEVFNPQRYYGEELKSLKFSGDDTQINEEIYHYESILNENSFSWNLTKNEQQMYAEDFLKYLKDLRNIKYHLLDSLNQAKELSAKFMEWAKYDIDYNFSSNLFHYTWYNPQIKNKLSKGIEVMKIPQSFYQAIADIPVSNENAMMNSNYRMFLYQYFFTTTYYNSEFFKTSIKYRKNKMSQKEYENYLKIIQKNYKGIAKDILISQRLYGLFSINRTDIFEGLYPKYKKSLPDDFCQILDKGYNEVKLTEKEFDNNTNLYQKENKIEKVAGNILNKIIDENKGKVIYMDFWATWCGPCLMEMKTSRNLADSFKGKDIAFVYCCLKSDKNKWQDQIRELKLPGSSYLLNDSEYDILSQKFQITGIPHYVLIDKNGNVVNKNAPRPSSGEELVEILNKYLN